MADAPPILWEPPADVRDRSRIGTFIQYAEMRTGRAFEEYADLWEWSVSDLEGFWEAVAAFFDVRFHTHANRPLSNKRMPNARWFEGAELNYAEHALRGPSDDIVIRAVSDTRPAFELTRGELTDQVARAAEGLRRLGVEQGDRVVAYMPNIPETLIGFLAAASIGAVWSTCAPEFGTATVIDRFSQIEPKVLLTVDGYRYGPKAIHRHTEVTEIRSALPSLEHTVLVPYLGSKARPSDVTWWEELISAEGVIRFEPVPFDHPLYILYSSGTTGVPKAIIHGHGGILLEHLKALALHLDLGAGDRFFWYTTTGWMMWNYLMSGLLVGASVVLFDGHPAHPDLSKLWQLAADTGVTCFGVSAPYIMNCRKEGLNPGRDLDLSRIRQVGSTGSALPPEGYRWVYESVHDRLMLNSASGGTDVCTAFVGCSPLLPVWEGEISGPCLGAKVEAFDGKGRPVVGQVGELVVSEPMPSMPVGFWADANGAKYRDSYFSKYPGVWRHGDWIRITDRGSSVITGRSDATLNRGGVRMGTAEFYRVVEELHEVRDALVIHLDDLAGSAGRLVMFVAPAPGVELDEELRKRILRLIREQLSPRHVPDELHVVPEVPKTLSGKKLEIPIKRLLEGARIEEVASEGALLNPRSLDAYLRIVNSLK